MNQNLRLLFVFLLLLFASQHVHAASQAECSIWICAPGGFPSGCGAAHAAMVHRIEHFQPPLPPFLECAENEPGHSTMSYNYNYAAYVPAARKCVRWQSDVRGDDSGFSYCSQWSSWSAHWVKNKRCRKHCHEGECSTSPEGCTATARFIDVFVDGQLAGETYYWGTRPASRLF